MHAQNWTDVLTLLSMMIMGDEDKSRSQSKRFRLAAVKLRDAVNPNLMLTEEMAFDWFQHRRDTISKNMSSVHYASTVDRLLGNLNLLPNKKELVIALMKIGLSDDDTQPRNSRVLDQFCEAWDLNLALAG